MSSPNSPSSPSDLWANKSRNAKAQARHRAKRKAYIEQLEQNVSKLQTALALSTEDVANLPTAQMKLRELKEENDTLRAEIHKMRSQQHYPYTVPSQGFSPSLRHAKRRRSSQDHHPRNVYLASTLFAFVASVLRAFDPSSILQESGHHTIDQAEVARAHASRLNSGMPTSTASHFISVPTTVSPTSGGSLVKEEYSPWSPFTHPSHSIVPPGWQMPTHQPRPGTASSASSSSDASPIIMASFFPFPTSAPSSPFWLRFEPSSQTSSIDPSNALALGITDANIQHPLSLSYSAQ